MALTYFDSKAIAHICLNQVSASLNLVHLHGELVLEFNYFFILHSSFFIPPERAFSSLTEQY